MNEYILDKIDNQFVKQLLSDYGSPCYEDNDNQLRFRTVCHGGDSHKLYYYPDTKLFVCYTCCGGMDVFGLVSKLEDCSYGDAIKIVTKRLGLSNANRKGFNPKYEYEQDYNTGMLNYKKYIEAKEQTIYDENILKCFDANTFYKGWIDEGISIETMQKFGIEWDAYEKKIIIPNRDINGNLIGVRRRYIDNPGEEKYKPIWFDGTFYTFKTGYSLYGLYQNQDIIRKTRRAVIFEGEKSVMKCDSYFGDYPAVATYTCNITDYQIKMLTELGVNKIILAYDQDKINEMKTISKRLNNNGLNCYYLDGTGILGDKDSPVDKGLGNYKKLMKERKQR